MPKEKRKRGRRGAPTHSATPYDQSLSQAGNPELIGDLFPAVGSAVDNSESLELLESREYEYFYHAETLLSSESAFPSAEDRQLFLAKLSEEMAGKEIMLIKDQIGSKLMERFISLSSAAQTKKIVLALHGRLTELANNKYASHCCESLMIRAAVLRNSEDDTENIAASDDSLYISLENVILLMAREFEPSLLEMIRQTYASHVLRTLIIILSGNLTTEGNAASKIMRSQKSNEARQHLNLELMFSRTCRVPPVSFSTELRQILQIFNDSLSSSEARNLAIDSVSGPAIEVLLFAAKTMPSLSILPLLFSPTRSDSSEEAFFQHLITTNSGTHFLRFLLRCADEKSFHHIYSRYVDGKEDKLLRYDGSYLVLQTVLMQSGKEQSSSIISRVLPKIDFEASQALPLLTGILTLASEDVIDRSTVYQAIINAYRVLDSPREEALGRVFRAPNNIIDENFLSGLSEALCHKLALFCSALCEFSNDIGECLLESVVGQSLDVLLDLCEDKHFSKMIETFLKQCCSAVLLRKFLNKIIERTKDLACSKYGSYVLDTCWDLSSSIFIYRERLADRMVTSEDALRDSPYGSKVLKNCQIDLYKSRPSEWRKKMRRPHIR